MNSNKKKNQKNRIQNLTKVEPGYISLAEATKTSPYSQEYLSLLARQGKLQAKKFGRNWYITSEALNDYLTNQGIKIVLPKHLFNASYRGKITKALNFLPFGESGYQGVPKAILAQIPKEPIDLSGALGEPEEEKKEPELTPLPSEKLPPKELLEEKTPIQKTEEVEKEEIKERKKEKVLEPFLIRTMAKDIKALKEGRLPEKEIPIAKEEVIKEAVPEKPLPKIEKVPLIKEEVKIPEEIAEKEEIVTPKKEILEKKEVPLIEKEEVKVIPIVEKKRLPEEKPVEERVLERLLQAIEARIPPARITGRIARLNGMANQYFRSTPKAILVSIVAIVILLLLVGGVSFGNLDKAAIAVHNFFKDAQTLQGSRPGTHANEVLLLDKNGNISIYGHIETKGQLRSWVEQGVAPIVVESATTVENLSADYLDNLSSQDFTLAFVTKNGNVTYEDVRLEGNVEVGKTLLVKGATKLLDSLFVYGKLGAFGGIETQGADLNLGSGTIITTNQNLVTNLNADLLDSMHASDFNLHFVTSQGSNTYNDISVGGLNVSGFFGQYASFRIGGGERNVGLIDTKNWGISVAGHLTTKGNISTERTLDVAGQATFTGTPGSGVSSATLYINPSSAGTDTVLLGAAVDGTEKFRVDAEGDLMVAGISTFSGNIVLSSPANLTLNAGDLVVNQLSAPSGVSAQATTSGSLAADTYYYIVTALNNNGQTTTSDEVSATIDGSTTTAAVISWNAVSGASSYRVYGRSPGAQDQYWGTTATSLVDTGTNGTNSTAPIINTTGGTGSFYSGLNVYSTTTARSIVPETAYFYLLGSPTLPWSDLYVETIHATTTNLQGNILMADDQWIGLGETAGRLVFDDQNPDYLTFQNADVGIATTSPRYKLDVWGNAGFGTTTDTNTPVLYIDSGNGYLGIGTSTPSYPLHVVGTSNVFYVESNFGEGSPGGGGGTTFALKNASTTGDVAFDFYSGANIIGNIGYITSDSFGDRFFILENNPNNLNLALVDNSLGHGGNVSIGTTTPRYKLHVWGDAAFGTTSDTNVPTLYVDSGDGGRVGIGTTTLGHLLTVAGGNIVIASGGATTTLSYGDSTFAGDLTVTGDIDAYTSWTAASTTYLSIVQASTTYLYLPDWYATTTWNGILGIATSTPSHNLSVEGDAYFSDDIIVSGANSQIYLKPDVTIGTDAGSAFLGNAEATFNWKNAAGYT